jgi:hypothetical protein
MSNSSKDPKVMLNNALDRGYHRILFQQGEPVLDRELTLLGDLASPERLASSYLGNGVPVGDNGFAITNLFGNDFTVTAGRCLVGGREVRLGVDTTYRSQRHTPNAAPLPAGKSNVYLHVFTKEVTATEDPDLANAGDVGIETSVREKVDWEIQLGPITTPIYDADHLLLAVIDTDPPPVTPIEDHRRTGLTLGAVRDEITAARGSAADLTSRLNTSLASDGTLNDGVAPLRKLKTTIVQFVAFNVPAAPLPPPPGQFHEQEEPLYTTQTFPEQPFLLVSVNLDGPAAGSPPQPPNYQGMVEWSHRVRLNVSNSTTFTYTHLLVIRNFSSFPAQVSCKAYMLSE